MYLKGKYIYLKGEYMYICIYMYYTRIIHIYIFSLNLSTSFSPLLLLPTLISACSTSPVKLAI